MYQSVTRVFIKQALEKSVGLSAIRHRRCLQHIQTFVSLMAGDKSGHG